MYKIINLYTKFYIIRYYQDVTKILLIYLSILLSY